MSVLSTNLHFFRSPTGKVIATAGVDVQPMHFAKPDERIGAKYCPDWDETGGASVLFVPQGGSKPVGMVGEEVLTIHHDGHRRFEVRGFVPNQTNMCDATFVDVLKSFRIHGGTYA
jgi:hypothetical protein